MLTHSFYSFSEFFDNNDDFYTLDNPGTLNSDNEIFSSLECSQTFNIKKNEFYQLYI